MKRLPVIITALLFGAIRGVQEGMIMSMTGDALHTGIEGVRGHAWFQWYHAVGILSIIFCIALAFEIYSWYKFRKSALAVYVGVTLLFWFSTEIAYSFTRWGAIRPYEHIVFADLISYELYGAKVYVLHIARLLTGGVLVWRTR